MRKEALCQAAVTLALPQQTTEPVAQTLQCIVNGKPITEIEAESLWELYDWLDSAIDAAYNLFPHVQTALRGSGFVPTD